MIKPDFNRLKVTLDKTKKAGDSELGWREFLVAVSYFTNLCSYRIMEDEIVDITKSIQNWNLKKDNAKYLIKNSLGNFIEGQIKLGDIFLADLGINYKPECAYVHPVLILEEIGSMVLVIPTSTNSDKISTGYHPIDNISGKWYHRKVYNADGFDDTCVLLLNNLKVLSKGRLLEKKGQLNENITKETSIFYELKNTIFEHYLPKQYINFLKLSDENKRLLEKISELEEQNQMLLNKIDNEKKA